MSTTKSTTATVRDIEGRLAIIAPIDDGAGPDVALSAHGVTLDRDGWKKIRDAGDAIHGIEPEDDDTPERSPYQPRDSDTIFSCKILSYDKLAVNTNDATSVYLNTYTEGEAGSQGPGVRLSEGDRRALAAKLLDGLESADDPTPEGHDPLRPDDGSSPEFRFIVPAGAVLPETNVMVRRSYVGTGGVTIWQGKPDELGFGSSLNAGDRARLARLLTVGAKPAPELPEPAEPTNVAASRRSVMGTWFNALDAEGLRGSGVVLAPIVGACRVDVRDQRGDDDGTATLDADQLRQLAANCIEAARKLDEKADW